MIATGTSTRRSRRVGLVAAVAAAVVGLLAGCSTGTQAPASPPTESSGAVETISPPTIMPVPGIEDVGLQEMIAEQVLELSTWEGIKFHRVDSYASGSGRLIVDAGGSGDLTTDRASMRTTISGGEDFLGKVSVLDPGFPKPETLALTSQVVMVGGDEPLAYVTFEGVDQWTDRWLEVSPDSPHIGLVPETRSARSWRDATLAVLSLEATNVHADEGYYDVSVPLDLALELLATPLRALIAAQGTETDDLPAAVPGQVQGRGGVIVLDYTALIADVAAASDPDVAAQLAGLQLQTRFSFGAVGDPDVDDAPPGEMIISEPPT